MSFSDIGIVFQIVGFFVFMFVPIIETNSFLVRGPKKFIIQEFMHKHPKFRFLLRGLGLQLVIVGLALQLSFIILQP